MQDYVINVTEIEELQTLRDLDALERIFARAQSTVVNGAVVVLVRQRPGAAAEKFDELSTESDLKDYKERVYRYL